MTKKELEAAVMALMAQQAASNTQGAPAASAPASWITEAKAARTATKAATAAPHQPKPLVVEVITVSPKPGGEPFAPYRALAVSNQAHGRFYKRVVLDARWLAAVRGFTGQL